MEAPSSAIQEAYLFQRPGKEILIVGIAASHPTTAESYIEFLAYVPAADRYEKTLDATAALADISHNMEHSDGLELGKVATKRDELRRLHLEQQHRK